MSEDFLLKWNDHHSLFFVGAEELCESEEYTDVTLAAGSKFFPAHKLVLSICSPYFRQLFKHLGRDKSVVFLKDVDHSHLDLLLQYMYKGEIKVQEDELVAVLNTAQVLEIKGLSQNQTKVEGHINSPEQKFRPPNIKRPNATTENKEPVSKKRISNKSNDFAREDLRTSSPATNNFSSIQTTFPQQTELYQVKEEISPVHMDMGVPDQGGGNVVDQGHELSNCHSVEPGVDGGFDAEFDQEVVELDHSGQFENGTDGAKVCPYCHKEFKKMSSLKQHLPVHTKEKNFECTLCNASYTRSSSLYSHMRQKHQQNLDTQPYQEFLD